MHLDFGFKVETDFLTLIRHVRIYLDFILPFLFQPEWGGSGPFFFCLHFFSLWIKPRHIHVSFLIPTTIIFLMTVRRVVRSHFFLHLRHELSLVFLDEIEILSQTLCATSVQHRHQAPLISHWIEPLTPHHVHCFDVAGSLFEFPAALEIHVHGTYWQTCSLGSNLRTRFGDHLVLFNHI